MQAMSANMRILILIEVLILIEANINRSLFSCCAPQHICRERYRETLDVRRYREKEAKNRNEECGHESEFLNPVDAKKNSKLHTYKLCQKI